jgi:CBS domain containing-hemolysin-like protein
MNIAQKIKDLFVRHPEEEKVLETIEEIMDEREERGDDVLVDPDELLLLKNLFRLKDIRANQVMIPRIDITGISATAQLSEVKDIIIRDKFTRLPVYDKTLDNIVGVVHVKDLLCKLFEVGGPVTVQDVMTHSVLFVPPSIRVLDLLRDMQAKRTQMAVVVDEYGGTAGLVTLEDLLEEIVGEIEDEHDALDAPPVLNRIKDNIIDADARVLLKDLEDITGPFVSEEVRSADIDTIGGLVFHLAGRLPHKGEIIHHDCGFKFKIVDADLRCIKRVRITLPKVEKNKKESKTKRGHK